MLYIQLLCIQGRFPRHQKELVRLQLTVHMVLLHNGGFCNGCITKRCLHNSRNESLGKYLVLQQLLNDKR
jgi:hypothetical protein